MKYLWDTNIVIYYLQQQFPPAAEKFIDSILPISQPAISAITEIELLCWKTDNEEDTNTLQSFISDAQIFELEKNIKIKTVEIRRANSIKLPDAIIAATALIHDFTLLTRNLKDFKKVNGLQVISPWEV